MGDYFITGYTGFCPDMSEHIGYNYQKATREIMKAHPHIQTRLSAVHYPDRHHPKGECQYFCPVPDYRPAYNEGSPEARMWRPYQGNYAPEARYPEQAYPLTCSEWVSPCVGNHCNEMYAPCIRRQSYACHDHVMMSPGMSYQNFQQRNQQPPEACCDSRASGCRCSGGNNNESAVYKYPRKTSESCCDSRGSGCRCSGGNNNESAVYKYPRKTSEACCDSCANGGRCSGGNNNESAAYKYPRKKYRSSQIMDHRKGGVVPNYMGHIPGMQNSFGEPYATAASRLLRRHFDELSRKGL